jgi:hypothetical protein
MRCEESAICIMQTGVMRDMLKQYNYSVVSMDSDMSRIGSDHPVECRDRRTRVDRCRQRRDKRCARERDRGRKSGESVAVH